MVQNFNAPQISKLQIENSPLVVALRNGKFEVADVLIELGANVNSIEGEDRITPLSALIYSRDEAMPQYLEKLIAKGADINVALNIPYKVQNYVPNSPSGRMTNILSVVLDIGNLHVASILIENGAKLDDSSIFSRFVEFSDNQLKIAEMYIEAGVDPNSKIRDGRALLALAYEEKYVKLVKLLLAKGASPNVDSQVKDDPSHHVFNVTEQSAVDGEFTYLMLFLEAGGAPRGVDYHPPMDAIFSNYKKAHEIPLDTVKTLVEKGFVIRDRDQDFYRLPEDVRAYLREKFPRD